MKYGSVCSGIEAPTVAWHGLGWEPQWFSEIENFPCAVLKHHYPGVINLGDMTKLHERKEFNDRAIDLLVGGTPCQSFSIAGHRKGLDDPRGNLALHFLKLVDAKRPRWVVWENVPGVLSSGGGRDFGSFVGGLAQLGYGWAYRILDAQYFRVPQRRRRVFVVGYLGDWRPASAVLFERQSLSGDNPPSRKKREGVAGGFEIGPTKGSFTDIAPTMDARAKDEPIRNQIGVGVIAKPLSTSNQRIDFETETFITGSLVSGGDECQNLTVVGTLNASKAGMDRPAGQGNELDFLITHSLSQRHDSSEDGTGRGTPIVFQQPSADGHARVSNDGQVPTLNRMGGGQREPCIVIEQNTQSSMPDMISLRAMETPNTVVAIRTAQTSSNGHGLAGDVAHTIDQHQGQAAAFTQNQSGAVLTGNHTPSMGTNQNATGRNTPKIQSGMMVRRLTPRECSRLQGFPDNYLDIIFNGKPASDGPRYKALGNSMAVPCMVWLGKRIQKVEDIINGKKC